jgi:hypothetical protein
MLPAFFPINRFVAAQKLGGKLSMKIEYPNASPMHPQNVVSTASAD